jgi:hypothetical protein
MALQSEKEEVRVRRSGKSNILKTHPFGTIPEGDTFNLDDGSPQLTTILEEETEAIALLFDSFNDLRNRVMFHQLVRGSLTSSLSMALIRD